MTSTRGRPASVPLSVGEVFTVEPKLFRPPESWFITVDALKTLATSRHRSVHLRAPSVGHNVRCQAQISRTNGRKPYFLHLLNNFPFPPYTLLKMELQARVVT